LAAQNLETLTGITPTEVVDFPTTTLEPEAPISYWLSNTQTPADRVQEELNLASTAGRRAATAALLPTLSANAQERLTNATGLSGHQSVYQIQAVATFKLDWSTYATSRTQGAADSVQQIRAARTRRMTRDAIFEAFRRIETGIAKCKSTRAQSESARKASVLATERYRAGTATQLDVTQAQRDAFVAEAGRIQADADLAFARIQLRTLTGKLIAKSR
jgi:outer membrane protein TolC